MLTEIDVVEFSDGRAVTTALVRLDHISLVSKARGYGSNRDKDGYDKTLCQIAFLNGERVFVAMSLEEFKKFLIEKKVQILMFN